MSAVREAFGRHAAAYDQVFSCGELRSEIWEMADRLFLPGMHLLDLGCGTGEDALHFADRGVHVTAIDISPEMISQLRRKLALIDPVCSKAGGAVRYEAGDMRRYRPASSIDGVFSNFGALNCIAELDWLLRLPVVSGGHLVLTLLGRFYPLECAVSLLKGKPGIAFRRLRQAGEAEVEGVRFTVYYHSLRSMKAILGAKYDLVSIRGLRSIAPAPHLVHLRRWPVIRFLEKGDRWLCSKRLTATASDHHVSIWRRRET